MLAAAGKRAVYARLAGAQQNAIGSDVKQAHIRTRGFAERDGGALMVSRQVGRPHQHASARQTSGNSCLLRRYRRQAAEVLDVRRTHIQHHRHIRRSQLR